MSKLWLLVNFCCLFTFSQTGVYKWPLQGTVKLNGNYGELRPNHFHAGLDFATGQAVGMPVYSAEAGYVSRVKVSAYGYGNAIYVTHPNGRVTLYAHLSKYSSDIADLVIKEQFKAESFEIDIYPEPGKYKIKAGQLLAWSGNSGGSSGPHLHFEVRDALTEAPINPLLYYTMKDDVKPVATHIAFYNLEDTCAPVFLKDFTCSQSNKMKLKNDSITFMNNILGLAFSGFDSFTQGGSKNAVYGVKLLLDNKLIYHHQMDSIAFSSHRYVNEFSEKVNNVRFQKCFIPTLFPSGMYKDWALKGRIILRDTLYHKIELILFDEAGNENKLLFFVRSKKMNYYKQPTASGDFYIHCSKDLTIRKKDIYLSIPIGSTYYSFPAIIDNLLETQNKLVISPSNQNLNSPITIGFSIPKKFQAHADKTVMLNNGSVYIPTVKSDSLFYSVKSLGSYKLAVDSIPPKIIPVNKASAKTKVFSGKTIQFTIVDALSGIGSYRFTVNGKWQLAEFDAKSKKVSCLISDELSGTFKAQIGVKDKCGNSAVYQFTVNL